MVVGFSKFGSSPWLVSGFPPFSGARFHVLFFCSPHRCITGLPYTRMARDQVAKTADEPKGVETHGDTAGGWLVKKWPCLAILCDLFGMVK